MAYISCNQKAKEASSKELMTTADGYGTGHSIKTFVFHDPESKASVND